MQEGRGRKGAQPVIVVEPGEIFQEIFWGLELFLVYLGKQSAHKESDGQH